MQPLAREKFANRTRSPRCERESPARFAGGAFGGTRLDNLLCDGLLPLLAAHTGRCLPGLWFHWFTGDLPPVLARGLRELGVFDGRARPACHGPAQGLLGWLLEREARAGAGAWGLTRFPAVR